MIFSIFIRLWKHHHYLILQHFSPKRNPEDIISHSFSFPLAFDILFPIFMDLSALKYYISDILEYVVFCDGFFYLSWYFQFLLYHIIQGDSRYQYFIHLYGQTIFKCMDISYLFSIHQLMDIWVVFTLGLLWITLDFLIFYAGYFLLIFRFESSTDFYHIFNLEVFLFSLFWCQL